MKGFGLRIVYPAGKALCIIFCLLCLFSTPHTAGAAIGTTKHNLSVTGPGEIKALTETRICIFCHTPHNAAPRTPLWNKDVEAVNYVLYSSTTLAATPSQPTGPSRLCLSCHDGTIALGAVRRPIGGIQTTGEITVGRPSYIGTVLSDDHPVSFSYYDSLPNPELFPVLPPGLIFYANGHIHCSTCHDAHEDAFRSPDKDGVLTGKFLVADNMNSELCIKCHIMSGWGIASHKTSASPVNDVLPVSPKRWPAWSFVNEWGCESCHTPHSAGGQQRLLNYANEEDNCYPCHDGRVAAKDIKSQIRRISSHNTEAYVIVHNPTESALSMPRHVECADCHNPHAANGNPAPAETGMVSGRLEKVSGVNLSGAEISPAVYEYQVCFKCHADLAPLTPFIPRVANITNTRLDFTLSNQSFHPVGGIGRNSNVPSLAPPSPDPEAPQNLNTNSIIYCTDCHSDDSGGSKGPHGSTFAPILKRRYETITGTTESYESYKLCYRCHNQASIMSNASFAGGEGHSGHIRDTKSPCSVCHDPHGVSGNTHLINFDTRYVKGPGDTDFPPPTFTDNGLFAGSCTLVCHFDPFNLLPPKVHNNTSYP